MRWKINPFKDINNFTPWQERGFIGIIIKVNPNKTPIIRINKGTSNTNLVHQKYKTELGYREKYREKLRNAKDIAVYSMRFNIGVVN